MSAGISNLGLGWEPQRNTSTAVGSQAEMAAQAAAQQAGFQQQQASVARPTSPTDFLSSLARQQADAYANMLNNSPEMAGYYQTNAKSTGDDFYKSMFDSAQTNAKAYGTGGLGALFGDQMLGTNFAQQYTDYLGSSDGVGVMAGSGAPAWGGQYAQQQSAANAQSAAISQQAAQAAAQAKAQADAAAQNQAVQQQAYGQQTGGGFNGGILNSSYSQPFGNTITGTQNPAGGFSGGLMSGAGQTAAPSTGLTPFGAGGASTGQQPTPAAGWGGPFSAKNPWSLG